MCQKVLFMIYIGEKERDEEREVEEELEKKGKQLRITADYEKMKKEKKNELFSQSNIAFTFV